MARIPIKINLVKEIKNDSGQYELVAGYPKVYPTFALSRVGNPGGETTTGITNGILWEWSWEVIWPQSYDLIDSKTYLEDQNGARHNVVGVVPKPNVANRLLIRTEQVSEPDSRRKIPGVELFAQEAFPEEQIPAARLRNIVGVDGTDVQIVGDELQISSDDLTVEEIESFFEAGSNVVIVHDAVTNKIRISATGGSGGGLTLQQVKDQITDQVNKSFVDDLDVDAETLDGQQGSYYLDYNNATNKPTIPPGLTSQQTAKLAGITVNDETAKRVAGDDIQSVAVSTSSAYQSTLNSQLTSDQPLFLHVTADISGSRSGTAYSYSENDVLFFAPLSDSAEFLFNIGVGGSSGTGGLTQAQVDQRIRNLVNNTALTTNTDRWAKNKLPEDTAYDADIPEQRVLEGVAASAATRLKIITEADEAFTTKQVVTHEATPQTATWENYTHANYIGSYLSRFALPRASNYVVGQWAWIQNEHQPYAVIDSDPITPGTQAAWEATPIGLLDRTVRYIGDFDNRTEATKHPGLAVNDIFFDRSTNGLDKATAVTPPSGQVLGYARNRLLNADDKHDIQTNIAAKADITNTLPWNLRLEPAGVTTKDLIQREYALIISDFVPARVRAVRRLDIFLANVLIHSENWDGSQPTTQGRLIDFEIDATEFASLASSIGDDATSAAFRVRFYDTATSGGKEIPDLVQTLELGINQPALNPEGGGSGEDQEARDGVAANKAIVDVLKTRAGQISVSPGEFVVDEDATEGQTFSVRLWPPRELSGDKIVFNVGGSERVITDTTAAGKTYSVALTSGHVQTISGLVSVGDPLEVTATVSGTNGFKLETIIETVAPGNPGIDQTARNAATSAEHTADANMKKTADLKNIGDVTWTLATSDQGGISIADDNTLNLAGAAALTYTNSVTIRPNTDPTIPPAFYIRVASALDNSDFQARVPASTGDSGGTIAIDASTSDMVSTQESGGFVYYRLKQIDVSRFFSGRVGQPVRLEYHGAAYHTTYGGGLVGQALAQIDARINAVSGITGRTVTQIDNSRETGFQGLSVWYGTEAQYTAITTKDANTIYFRS